MILNIVLWELFKRLIRPQTLTKLISKYGEDRLRELLAETAEERGEAGIRDFAHDVDLEEDSKLNGTWSSGFNSSNIDRIRWISGLDSTGTMEVQFLNGSVYQYYDVPQSVFLDFWNYAGSKGKWFWQHIRGGSAKTSNYAYAKTGAGVTSHQLRTKDSGYVSHYSKARR